MSWCIQVKGDGLSVAAYVSKITQYPQNGDQTHIETAKKLVLSEIAAIYTRDPFAIISVDCAGHADEAGNRQLSLKVEKLTLIDPRSVLHNRREEIDATKALLLQQRQAADAPQPRCMDWLDPTAPEPRWDVFKESAEHVVAVAPI